MNDAVRNTKISINYKNSRTGKSYKLDSYVESFTYVDNATGEGDTIDLSLNNNTNKFLYDYFPGENDMLSCSITNNNLSELKRNFVNCETFHVDKIGYSGMPDTFTINGISVPKNSTFSKTPKTKTWNAITIKEIAQKICNSTGISLFFTGGAENFSIKKIEQSNRTDLSFLYSLCQTYGLGMKIYSNRLVIFSEEYYEKKSIVATIKKNQILDGSFNADCELVRPYTGFTCEYSIGDTDWTASSWFEVKPKIMVDIGTCDSKADGYRKGRAKVNEAIKEMQVVSFRIPGNYKIIATSTIQLSGYGYIDGQYFVNKVTHQYSASGGYIQEIEARKIQQRL